MATNCESSTTHIDECEHAFLKNGVVEDVHVFTEDDHGSELIERIKTERGYDDVVCLCHYGSKVTRWSTWDGTKFTEPTLDYLYSIGISNENQAMVDARIAEQAAQDLIDAQAKTAAEAKLAALGLTVADVTALLK